MNQRLAPVPMEMNGIAVVPEADGTFTVWVSSQAPFDVRDEVAEIVGVDRRKVRAIAPDVGGGFGAKIPIYPEFVVVAKAAAELGRPVRWAESRTESMLSMTHGRAQVQWIELGARRDGSIVGARLELLGDVGAYPQLGSFMGQTTAEMISGVYAIPEIAFRGRAVVTNVTPLGAYRGAGRPEAAACIERAMDLLAAELGMDPVELRRRNLIAPDAFPYETASGATYDNGEYAKALDRALELADYDALRAEQAERRARGDRTALGDRRVDVRRDHGVPDEGVRAGGGWRRRERDRARGHDLVRPGARDGLRAARRGDVRGPAHRRARDPLRHRGGRTGPGKLGVAVAPGRWVGDRRSRRRGA